MMWRLFDKMPLNFFPRFVFNKHRHLQLAHFLYLTQSLLLIL